MSNETKTTGLAVVEPTAEISGNIAGLERWAKTLLVTQPAEYQHAAETLKSAKLWRGRVVEFFADTKAKAHATWKAIVSQEKVLTDRIDAVERIVKTQMATYTQEEERKRQVEQRRLQAIEEERARKERLRLEERARKAQEKGQTEKAEALKADAESVTAVAVQVQSATPDVSGVNIRKQWKGRVVDKHAMVIAAATNPNVENLLVPDESALNKLAVATSGEFIIAGVEFYQQVVMAVGQGRVQQ